MSDYFFIDSKSKASVDQYSFAFQNNLLRPEDVVVVVKFHFKNFLRHILCRNRYKFQLRFVFTIRGDTISEDKSRIFYFFNSVENVKLITNRRHTHIFFGHGESNKRASLHPLYRLYDYLLVSGPFAGKRLQEFDILNETTVKERVIDIGGANVANIDYDDLHLIGGGDLSPSARGLLYMPTWEGGVDTENYSTLEQPGLSEFLVEMAKKLSADFIFVKPHANIGSRRPELMTNLVGLIASIARQGIKLVMTKKDLAILPRSKRALLYARKCATQKAPPAFSCAVVEVSAAESMVAKIGVPSVVLASSQNRMYAPQDYLKLKGMSVIQLSDWQSMKECAAYACAQATYDHQKEYIVSFFDDDNQRFRQALDYIETDRELKSFQSTYTDIRLKKTG